MSQTYRPTHITTIMQTVAADYPADMVATLEAYLADLEARQPEHMKPIAAILKTIAGDLPLDAGAALVAYIAGLEAGQQPVQPAPESLYWQGERRASQRRERAMRKLNYR